MKQDSKKDRGESNGVGFLQKEKAHREMPAFYPLCLMASSAKKQKRREMIFVNHITKSKKNLFHHLQV